ncbi:MAG: hypothetical protein VCA55_07050 [Verrucomicrobiales bacterium]
MKSAILLASPKLRAHLRRMRIIKHLQQFAELPLSPQDRGYLRLAETVFSGRDASEREVYNELAD